MMKVCKCSRMWRSFIALKNGQIYRKVFETFFQREHCVILAPTIFFLLDLNFILRLTWRSCCKHNLKCDGFFFSSGKRSC